MYFLDGWFISFFVFFGLLLEVPEPWNTPFLSRGRPPWATIFCGDPGATAPVGFVDALHSIVGNLGAKRLWFMGT